MSSPIAEEGNRENKDTSVDVNTVSLDKRKNRFGLIYL